MAYKETAEIKRATPLTRICLFLEDMGATHQKTYDRVMIWVMPSGETILVQSFQGGGIEYFRQGKGGQMPDIFAELGKCDGKKHTIKVSNTKPVKSPEQMFIDGKNAPQMESEDDS